MSSTILYDNKKDGKTIRIIFLFVTLILSLFIWEGFRAGFMVYTEGYTPQLFGRIKASPIHPNSAIPIMVIAVFFGSYFTWTFFSTLIKGFVVHLEATDHIIIQRWNGLTKKEVEFEKKKIGKVIVKEQKVFNSSAGMMIHSYKTSIEYDGKKCLLMRNGVKKKANAVAREVRKWLKS